MRKTIVTIIIVVAIAAVLLFLKAALQSNNDNKTDALFEVAIEHWVTKKGAQVYFAQVPELPMVDIQVVFDAGAARDGNQNGLALLTNSMLSEGTAKLNADQIAEQFENVGAVFSQQVGRDMAILSLRSLTTRRQLEPALTLFAEVMSGPAFPPRAFSREQGRQLAAIAREQERPGSIANKHFYQALYGEHPYAHSVLGDTPTVEALTPDDLAAFHSQYYVGSNAVVAVVGDLTERQAKKIADTLMGSLPAGKPAAPLPDVIGNVEESLLQIQYPATQTHVLVGLPTIAQGDPDYFPLYVGNHILGGGALVSKLFNEVREQRGLAYSVYSSLSPMQQAGPFMMGLQTRADQAPEALAVLQDTLAQFTLEGPTEDELAMAKSNLIGSFPLRLGSNQAIVNQLALIGFFDLPLDYLVTFTDNIDAVSADDIQAAFNKVIVPERLQVIQVGDIAAQG